MGVKTRVAKQVSLKQYEDGIHHGDRIVLGQAITIVESTHVRDRLIAESLIKKLLSKTGKSIRVGITGAPGVGKSTFIEALGKYITSLGKRVAVLTIDPSSPKTKGSILGDKTRMEELSKDPLAFIRPTAAGNISGGVAGGTRESILLCEAAGYEVIIVETVGVGQSEVAVRGMVDFFLLLMLAGSGDELQGIKKGIMEMADGIAITKADGENISPSKKAQADFQHALHLFQPSGSGWAPKVLTTSAISGKGIKETWELVESFREKTTSNGFLKQQRDKQLVLWFHSAIDSLIRNKILNTSKGGLSAIKKRILAHKISPQQAANDVVRKFKI